MKNSKNIKSLEEFQVKEALKDQIPDHHKKILTKRIGKKYLDMEVPDKAENLTEGEWILTKEEKDEAIQSMCMVNVKKIELLLEGWKPSTKFINTIKEAKTIDGVIDIEKPSLLDLKLMTSNIYKLISIGETRGNRIMIKGDNGKPLLGEDNLPTYRNKEPGEIILSNNISNFNGFYESYMLAFPGENDMKNPFINPAFTNILSMAVDRNFDIDLFSKYDLQLYISSKSEDMLNMSISKFYDSCQNLYSGSHNKHLPANLFDSNVKIAYLKFNTPFTDKKKNIVPFTIFSRCLIRNVKGQIFFDMVYPGVLKQFFHKIVTKYTGMKNEYKGGNYFFTNIGLGAPYMDTLAARSIKTNPNATKDSRLMALATYLNHTPEDIFEIEKNIYVTDKGTFKVMTEEEANKATYSYLTDEMVYRQDIYKNYVNVQAFYDANIETSELKPDTKTRNRKSTEKLLKWYNGSVNFDEIAKWADEQPFKKVKKKDGTVERVPVPDKKNRITKHNLYRAMKPFIDPIFFAERTTPEQIANKRNKLAVDDIQIPLTDNLFAYRIQDRQLPGDEYDYDYDDEDGNEDDG